MKLLSFLTAAAITFASPFLPPEDQRVPPSPVGQAPFLWGVAMSGYQNEGPTPVMDWYSLEERGLVPEKSGKGPDFRGHMEADLDRAASLGINAFRTSIEWARLEPEPGRFDPEEVAYLHRLFKALKARGMTPVIALHHFATPRWVQQEGDDLLTWENPRTVEAYARYVEFVVSEFGEEIDYYLTFNEPSTFLSGGYVAGLLAPHRVGPVSAYRAVVNVADAHIRAYEIIHRGDARAMVSLPDYHAVIALPGGEVDYLPSQLLAAILSKTLGWDGRERVKYMDFLALHYYGTTDPSIITTLPPQAYRWGVQPEDFTRILKRCYETFKLPIMIAENGLATKNDEPRPDGWTREHYLVAHIQAMNEARRQGVPMMGYLHWTLTDNYEWGSFDARFGLWSVDIRSGDLTRRETPAVGVYREIVKAGGVTPSLAERYPPPAPPRAARRD